MSFTQSTESSSLSETSLICFHDANTVDFKTSIGLDDHKLLESISFLEQAASKENGEFKNIEEKTASITGTIVGNLHRLVNSSEKAADADIPEVFSELLRPSFLKAIFRYRQAVILQVPFPDTPEFVVDWAGLVLFKLGEAVLYFSKPRAQDEGFPWSDIQEFKMSPRKYARAASQLPATWSKVHSCLDSSCISEAAKRLAIYILFGVYMLSSRSARSRVEESDDLLVFKKSLYGYMRRAGSIKLDENQVSTVPSGLREHIFRSHYSLLLVLFSSLSLDTNNMSFHPSVTDGAMSLVEHVLLNDQKYIPILTLTEEQYPLFRWNSFILWLWKIWETGLCWHERILQITATWLYHFVIADSDLNQALQSDFCHGNCVAEILLTLIIHLTSLRETNETDREVLFKATWAFFFLFEKDKSLLSEMTLQKAFQIFLRLQITVGYGILDMSIRNLALQFTVETVLDHALTNTDEVTRTMVGVVQQVKDICSRNCRADLDESALMVHLPILILVAHHSCKQLSHILNSLVLSQLASVVEDIHWSTTAKLNALLLLSYLKIDDASVYCRLFSVMLGSARSSRDLQYAVVLAACANNVTPILSIMDSCVLLELWFYLVDVFLVCSDSESTPEPSPIYNTIICTLSLLLSQTSLTRNSAWASSPWTEVLHRHLASKNQSPGARALLQQLREATISENNQISKHDFTRRLIVVYIEGRAQLVSIIE